MTSIRLINGTDYKYRVKLINLQLKLNRRKINKFEDKNKFLTNIQCSTLSSTFIDFYGKKNPSVLS